MNFLSKIGCIGLFFSQASLWADTITIYNKCSVNVYVAPYYKCGSVATRCGEMIKIEPGLSIQCGRPSYKSDEYEIVSETEDTKFGYDRKLYITRKARKLKDKLLRDNRKRLTSQSIGWKHGSLFYIAEINFRLKGFNAFEWKIIRPVVEAGEQLVDEAIQTVQDSVKKLLPAVRHNRYKKITATVRSGNQLCSQERSYLNVRKRKVKRALEKLLRKPIDDNAVPTISIVASGGGFRAMLATIGFLHALEQLGLLDTITYISTLSGSTWAVGSWFAFGDSIALLRTTLFPYLAPGLLPLNFKEMRYFIDMLLVKWAFDQPVTVVDFYGALVGNKLLKHFGKYRHRIYLSDQASLLKYGDWPLPIYTAVRSDFRTNQEWYEFTPYEIGGAWLGHYVSSWAYGRRFEAGQSIDYAPEQSLSAHLGVFGSAFAATFNRMYSEVAHKISSDAIKKVMERILDDIGNQRLANSCFYNFTFGINSSPIGIYKYIELADAGLAFNLPYPPISEERPERKSDIIIFLDASYSIEGVPALEGVAKYAQTHRLAFPSIHQLDIDKKAITVLNNDHDPRCPVVIYMPWLKDESLWNRKKDDPYFSRFMQILGHFDPKRCLHSFCDTMNFEYSQHQAQQVAALAEFNMLASQDRLIEAIKRVVEARS